MVVAETRRNGTAVDYPIRTVEIDVGEFGYPGWTVLMRMNLPHQDWLALISLDDDSQWWPVFGKAVLAWNFVYEDKRPVPLPSTLASPDELNLDYKVLAFVFDRYLQAVQTATALPKAIISSSAGISSTNGADRSGE